MHHSLKSLENKNYFSFPEAKTLIIQFCSEGVKNRSLSSEAIHNEIITVIVPNFNKKLIAKATNDAIIMPSFGEMMHNLD